MIEEDLPPSVAYMSSLSGLQPWFGAADALGLVRGAWRTGLVQAARAPRDVAGLAADTGLDAERCAAVAEALVGHDVLDRDDSGHYRVTEAWAPLLLDDPPLPLESVIRYQLARMRLVEDAVAGGGDYWAASQDDRAAYAVGVSVDPETAHGVELIAAGQALNPVLTELLKDGARFLELGCGAAGAMCATLRLNPGVSAVGVELSEDLVRIARDRADRMGLADRMRVVHGDAADFVEPDGFDFGFWSQFFFPEPARAGALASLLRSVRPGGQVMAPLMGDPVTSVAELRTQDGREYAVDQVLHGGWGVPLRSPEQLAAELEAAGFAGAELLHLPVGRVVLARRP